MAPSIRRVDFGPQFPAAVTRVAAYARVSTGKDAMLHSLSAQVSYYSNMIQKHPGWLYCGVYADEGITGTKEDRENFCRMMADCRAGKLDLIITKGISRLSRNTVTLLETVRELKELGVDVFFEEQNIHTLSAAGELMLTILASFAQEESRSASDNQKWRVQKAFENGELMNWRFMLGYRIKDGEVSVYDPEAAAVREVFRRFIHGATMGSLAKYLNESLGRGVLGGTWKTQHVHVLLTNEKFTGNALLQKTFRNNHIEKAKRPNNGELPRYYAEGTHPAIIDTGTFQAVQERLREIAEQYRDRPHPSRSVLSGRVICGQCGRKYKRSKNHGRFIWNCSNYLEHGKATCPGGQIREDILLSAITEELDAEEFDPEAFQSKITAVRADPGQTLVFTFSDGRRSVKRWEKADRAGSWTPEKRESAGARTAEARRKQRERTES